MNKFVKIDIKPIIGKYNNRDCDLFELRFNIKDSLLTECVQSVAFSGNKIYVLMLDVEQENNSVSKVLSLNKDKIRTVTLITLTRSGEVVSSDEYKVDVVDVADFNLTYKIDDRELAQKLLVLEYK